MGLILALRDESVKGAAAALPSWGGL